VLLGSLLAWQALPKAQFAKPLVRLEQELRSSARSAR
jgi:hypothetical protein